MADKNWSQIGDEIEDMVRNALETKDFGQLSQNISRTVGEAMENVGKSVQNAVNKADAKTREAAEKYLAGHPRIHLIDPLDVEEMHNLMARCYLVMTDSGGLQEEAPSLGKPVLVLRRETERPEAIEAGTVKLAGVEQANIVKLARELFDDEDAYAKMAHAVNPYGDGKTSQRIVQAIEQYFGLREDGPAPFNP